MVGSWPFLFYNSPLAQYSQFLTNNLNLVQDTLRILASVHCRLYISIHSSKLEPTPKGLCTQQASKQISNFQPGIAFCNSYALPGSPFHWRRSRCTCRLAFICACSLLPWQSPGLSEWAFKDQEYIKMINWLMISLLSYQNVNWSRWISLFIDAALLQKRLGVPA